MTVTLGAPQLQGDTPGLQHSPLRWDGEAACVVSGGTALPTMLTCSSVNS